MSGSGRAFSLRKGMGALTVFTEVQPCPRNAMTMIGGIRCAIYATTSTISASS
ncbi:hypothetical protein QF001_004420 [Paraburkholderia youngii]